MHNQSQKTTTSTVLQNLDNLPDSAFIRLEVVAGLLSVSRSTVYRLTKQKKLTSYKLTERTSTWNLGEVRRFLAKQMEAQ